MTDLVDGYQPDWDVNVAEGRQAELFVLDVARMLAERSGEIEVKRDYRFCGRRNRHEQTPTYRWYVETHCMKRGKWEYSGICTTKAKLWVFVFGDYPGMIIADVQWIKRAVRRAKEESNTRIEEKDGSHPTKGFGITLRHLVQTREG